MRMKKMALMLAGVGMALTGLLFLADSMYFNVREGGSFARIDFPESTYFLYDLGVTDVNSDGILDIYTSNHFALQQLFVGDASGGYTDVLAGMGLYQVPEFPQVEDMGGEVRLDEDGVYIYWHENVLNVRNQNALTSNVIEGKLLLHSDVKVNGISASDIAAQNVDIESVKTLTGATSTTIKFELASGESLRLAPELIAIPIRFYIDGDYDLGKLFIGPNHVTPIAHEFNIFLRDRHGMAWADYTGDGLLDLFIVRGGLKGRMLQQPSQDDFGDELFVNGGAYFASKPFNSAQIKHGCSGHQVAWVDFDHDGDLDLYITCRREGQPNQLYRKINESTFEDVADKYNLGLQGKWLGPFLWLDFDNDQDQDLILEEDNKIWLFVNELQGAFTRRLITPNKGGVTKLTSADYDMDGDQDIYAASPMGSVLLVNTGNSFVTGNIAELGLPLSAESANWVDYDNDGLIDLHVVPGGIFQQQSNNLFTSNGLLEHTFHKSVEEARSTWFDLDNDGDRDLVLAVKYKPSLVQSIFNRLTRNMVYKRDWHIFLYKNLYEENHWLEVELIGPKENRQAIGAHVVLESENGTKIQQVVGHAEGSYSSQGHYRLYFGLGEFDRPESLTVVWPSGRLQTIEPEADKVITVEYEG